MKFFSLFLKGGAMGAANVIPGVSGGTIALITGIFEPLIHAIKSFDMVALRLLVRGRFKDFAEHINLSFLLAVFAGIGVSILSLARLLGFLFDHYPIFIWAYFFGLILASVYFVGKTIERWNIPVVFSFLLGTAIAVSLTLMAPATENSSFWYLILSGVVGACSMILPGLSGSFVLILMGNYQLVMIDAINELDLAILLPVALGAAAGILAFSWVLSYIFKRFKDVTVAVLTGFILGSLSVLWPWKHSYDLNAELIPVNSYGAFDVDPSLFDKLKVMSYEPFVPNTLGSIELAALGIALAGILSLWAIEKLAK